jgi:hypothetical protein
MIRLPSIIASLSVLALSGCMTDPRVNPARMDSAIQRGVAEGRINQANADDIKAQRVTLGMGPAEVALSWGYPQRVNSTVSRLGRCEQWVYPRGQFRFQFVHFLNGRVSAISSW